MIIVWFACDRWDKGCFKAAEGEGGGSWSCQMGEVRVPPRLRLPPAGLAEACGVELRGVRVVDRHLG